MQKFLFGLLCILLSILIIFNCIRIGFQGDNYYPLRTAELFDRIARVDFDVRQPFENFVNNISFVFWATGEAFKNVGEIFQSFGSFDELVPQDKQIVDFLWNAFKFIVSLFEVLFAIIITIPSLIFAFIFSVADILISLLNVFLLCLEVLLELIGVHVVINPIDKFNFNQFFAIFRDALLAFVL